MEDISLEELEALGRAVAQDVAGVDAVEQVEVFHDIDFWDEPIYHFSFLIDQDRARDRPGLIRMGIALRLRDHLVGRGDYCYPRLQMLDRRDWERRARARPV